MTTPTFETFLARIYTDADLRRRFLDDPQETARTAGLSPEECASVVALDRTGLKLAAKVFAKKRARLKRPSLGTLLSRLLRRV